MDREKVIKGLEHCKKYGFLGGNDCNGHYEYTDNLQEIIKANNHRKDCPYGQCRTGCVVTLVGDALALLKEDCHNCKLECLLQKYDQLKEKYDELLEEQEEQIKNRDESLEKAREEIKWLRGMLKEQEAVKPILKREGRNKYYNDYCCPICDNDVVYEQNFCSECGRPCLWEGR